MGHFILTRCGNNVPCMSSKTGCRRNRGSTPSGPSYGRRSSAGAWADRRSRGLPAPRGGTLRGNHSNPSGCRQNRGSTPSGPSYDRRSSARACAYLRSLVLPALGPRGDKLRGNHSNPSGYRQNRGSTPSDPSYDRGCSGRAFAYRRSPVLSHDEPPRVRCHTSSAPHRRGSPPRSLASRSLRHGSPRRA